MLVLWPFLLLWSSAPAAAATSPGEKNLVRNRPTLLLTPNSAAAHLHLQQLLLGVNVRQHLGHAGLEHHAAHDNLVEDVVDLVDVEDEVQLTDIFEALVERLDKDLDEVQNAELALRRVDGHEKIERGVMAVD